MSPSKRLLTRYLHHLMGLGGVVLLASCGSPSVACVAVELEEECPSVGEAADILVGTDQCTSPVETVVSVVRFNDRYDLTDPATGEPGNFADCCYDVMARVKPGAGHCAIGRPLTHQGQPVLAALGSSGAWNGARRGQGHELPAAARQTLAAYWAEVARMEHASVAAFARVALELMALGAPSELVEGAHTAALDEVRHARAAFALASGYGEEPVGPGPLPMPDKVLEHTDLIAMAVATVHEGCVGETLAAVLAAEQLRHASDPAVVEALRRVVDEEAQHAELGWSIVRWAIEAGGEPVRQGVAQAFDEAMGVADLSLFPEPMEGAQGHGMVSRARLAAVAQGAWREVIAPAAAELVA